MLRMILGSDWVQVPVFFGLIGLVAWLATGSASFGVDVAIGTAVGWFVAGVIDNALFDARSRGQRLGAIRELRAKYPGFRCPLRTRPGRLRRWVNREWAFFHATGGLWHGAFGGVLLVVVLAACGVLGAGR